MAACGPGDPIVPALAESRELILIDLPGHGKSPPIVGRQTIAAYADAIAAFIAELSRRGIGGDCVALDRGGFWQGRETRFSRTTLAASIRLVRLPQPAMPSCPAMRRRAPCCSPSSRPSPGRSRRTWCPTEMRSLAATKVFDDVVRELADGPLQAGSARPLAG